MNVPHNEDWIEEQVQEHKKGWRNTQGITILSKPWDDWLRETLAAAIQRGTENLEVNSPEWKQWCADLRAEGAKQESESCAVLAWSTGMELYLKESDSREIGSAIATAIRERGSPRSEGPVKK